VLRQRDRQPEIMDGHDMMGEEHALALRGLERINAWSGSARILWPALARLAGEGRKEIAILDVATGAGDVPVRLWHKAQRAGLNMILQGIDRSPSAIAYARRQALDQKADVRFLEWDALHGSLPAEYDAVVCSLFLHHLSDDEAVDLLRRMATAARHVVLVNDLERNGRGLLLAYLGTRLLSRSPVVHIDGLRSVRAAFTRTEARALAQRAGLNGAEVSPRWPCRYLLTWRRP
jgi:2-polyprenyl-3-methyl-5-hydroxy-6-metoxy-1,4-benzoquinol methylase